MVAVHTASPTFELKSAALTLVALVLKTTDLSLLEQELDARFGDAPGLFDQDPVAIDLSQVRGDTESIDFIALVAMLRRFKMLPIAAKSGTAAQMEEALAAGLVEAHGNAPPPRTPAAGERPTIPVDEPPVTLDLPSAPFDGEAGPSLIAPASPPLLDDVIEIEMPPSRATLIVDKPLRSGQRIYARGADLIVLAVVSFGAEVIADGNIHVYAPLRGRALAGAMGDVHARIFSTCLEPQLLSVAGIWRTTETELPKNVLGKPAQVRLDGETLVIEPLNY